MKLLKKTIFTSLILTTIYGWYPDYTVLATDFKLRNDFLLPTQMNSINLVGLGNHFKNIYSHPLDNAFLNPAYINYGERNYLYFDLAGQEFDGYGTMEYPIYAYDGVASSDYSSSYNPYWTPYREVESSAPREPIFRAVYLGRPFCESSLGIGFTAEYFYDLERFFQPYWYGGGLRDANAAGEKYEQGVQDPYNDYRLVEAGKNDESTSGFRVSGLLSYPIMENLTLGARYTLHQELVDGAYRDLNDQDDDYGDYSHKYFNDSHRQREQDFTQNDLSIGAIWEYDDNTRLGLNIGRASGDINREYTVNDTSFYHSTYNRTAADSNFYSNWSNLDNAKKWNYNGYSYYGTAHGDVEIEEGLLLRFSIFNESAKADLDESEVLRQTYLYDSSWWSEYDSTQRNAYDNSWATLNRSGEGKFERNNLRLTAGVDWALSPILRFIGGISIDHLNVEHSATEPLTGTKYSFSKYDGYEWVKYETLEITQEDKREFTWKQNRKVTTFALPLGAVVSPSKYFEFQIGLTKVMQKINVDESYDVIVYTDKRTEVRDGATSITEENDYVDGHELPVIKDFRNEFEFNFGATIKYENRFGVTAVLTESLLNPRSLKIGAYVSW